MLPKSQNNPSVFTQVTIDLSIALHITDNFRHPEGAVASNLLLFRFPPVTVPKVTVAENCDSVLKENEIRFPEYCWVLSDADFCPPQGLFHNSLDLRTCTSDPRHIEADLSLGSLSSWHMQN